jgi:hypothetical protein
MPSLLTELRGAKPSLISGTLWLTAVWLWFGGHIEDAFGGECGAIAGQVCASRQSDGVRRIALAIDYIGPVGTAAAFSVLALLVGGTMNFLLGQALHWKFRNILHDLMGWSSTQETRASEVHPGEWANAVEARGEGLSRLAAAPPGLAILAFLIVHVSAWWAAALLGIPLVIWHGSAAMTHFETHIKAMSDRNSPSGGPPPG